MVESAVFSFMRTVRLSIFLRPARSTAARPALPNSLFLGLAIRRSE